MTQRRLQDQLASFVAWLRPEDEDVKGLKRQADEIRRAVRDKAQESGLRIQSTPEAGSSAKNTGLRRHWTGGSAVEGLDADLVFVVWPDATVRPERLLNQFEGFAARAYPSVQRRGTNSSVRLAFSKARRTYDLVPVLASDRPERQILVRRDGERIEASVTRHVEFIRKRTHDSNQQKGPVRFNECVRLVKWWREFRGSSTLEVPSFLLELLCAHAYDRCGVSKTYADTMEAWFKCLTGVAGARQRVAFADAAPLPPRAAGAIWEVLDPVNPASNVCARWHESQVNELARWLREARDLWTGAVRADQDGHEPEVRRCMLALLGTPFRHFSGV